MAISMASMICRFLKISPIWNPQRPLWWNKAALKAHLLTSPLMFCSNAIRWKPSLSKNTSILTFSIHSLGTFAWDQLGMGGILETDRKNHFHFHFFMIFNFAASNLATVSKEQMYGWGTIGCTARTATPTMRVNFFSSQGHQTSNKDNFHFNFSGLKFSKVWLWLKKENLHQTQLYVNCLGCIVTSVGQSEVASDRTQLHHPHLTKYKSINPSQRILIFLSIIYSVASIILGVYYTLRSMWTAKCWLGYITSIQYNLSLINWISLWLYSI